MHVKTEFRINVYRFGQATSFNQAFPHSVIVTLNTVCVHLLELTYLNKVIANAVFADLT